jgi:hypothetical protein
VFHQNGPVLTITQRAQTLLLQHLQLPGASDAPVPLLKVKLTNPFLGISVERVSENYAYGNTDTNLLIPSCVAILCCQGPTIQTQFKTQS